MHNRPKSANVVPPGPAINIPLWPHFIPLSAHAALVAEGPKPKFAKVNIIFSHLPKHYHCTQYGQIEKIGKNFNLYAREIIEIAVIKIIKRE